MKQIDALRHVVFGDREKPIVHVVQAVLCVLVFGGGLVIGVLIPSVLQSLWFSVLIALGFVDRGGGEAGWIAAVGMCCLPIIWCGIAWYLGLRVYKQKKNGRYPFMPFLFYGLAFGAVPSAGMAVYFAVITIGVLVEGL